jgi:L-lysine exporter family protein LysE/ArgO
VLVTRSGGAGVGLAGTVLTCLALTWLNPHVYLDTVVLLGSTASTYGAHRWQFATGAGLGSVVWFTGLGYGARLLRPVFARPAAWRVLDGGIAVVLAALAASLTVRGVIGT